MTNTYRMEIRSDATGASGGRAADKPEVSFRRGATVNASLPAQSESDADVHTTSNANRKPAASMDKLPVHLLRAVFSYLNPEERRSARGVCTKFNQMIAVWSKYTDVATFHVTRSNSSNSYETIQKSTVPWKKMELRNINATMYESWEFPTILNESVTSLTLRQCKFTWNWLIKIASRFQSPEKLTLIKCKMDMKSRINLHRNRSFFDYSRVFHGNGNGPKRNLKLIVEMENYGMLNFWLRQFAENIGESPFALTALETAVLYPPEYGVGQAQIRSETLLREFSRALQNVIIASGATREIEVSKGESGSCFECGNLFEDDNLGLMLECLRSRPMQ